MEKFYSVSEVADILGVSKETLRRWDRSNKLVPKRHPINGYRVYDLSDLRDFEQLSFVFHQSKKPTLEREIRPFRHYTSIELFAGAGGLALGFENAGIHNELLNEIDKDACQTLRNNRPSWNVIEGDISKIDFTSYQGKVDVVSGGFPCQAFSYAGKKLGFQDARGTLFYEFARAVNEVKPLIAIGENVRGLLSHEDGKTLQGMLDILEEIGYQVLPPQVLKAIFFQVPQKRERVIIVALRKDANLKFEYPVPSQQIRTLRDALLAGSLYPTDVPKSEGAKYPKDKANVLKLVPPGGYWRDLPEEIQKEYMKQSYYLGGGKTGMARRISWDEPSLTLTCSPAQKQTERCHPDETRPFTVREYARIQTFPDEWQFSGSLSSQYKQIGNAVPVLLGEAVGRSVVECLNLLEENVGM
jgi:DNA (cytosine-5)-methyltransferase 1